MEEERPQPGWIPLRPILPIEMWTHLLSFIGVESIKLLRISSGFRRFFGHDALKTALPNENDILLYKTTSIQVAVSRLFALCQSKRAVDDIVDVFNHGIAFTPEEKLVPPIGPYEGLESIPIDDPLLLKTIEELPNAKVSWPIGVFYSLVKRNLRSRPRDFFRFMSHSAFHKIFGDAALCQITNHHGWSEDLRDLFLEYRKLPEYKLACENQQRCIPKKYKPMFALCTAAFIDEERIREEVRVSNNITKKVCCLRSVIFKPKRLPLQEQHDLVTENLVHRQQNGTLWNNFFDKFIDSEPFLSTFERFIMPNKNLRDAVIAHCVANDLGLSGPSRTRWGRTMFVRPFGIHTILNGLSLRIYERYGFDTRELRIHHQPMKEPSPFEKDISFSPSDETNHKLFVLPLPTVKTMLLEHFCTRTDDIGFLESLMDDHQVALLFWMTHGFTTQRGKKIAEVLFQDRFLQDKNVKHKRLMQLLYLPSREKEKNPPFESLFPEEEMKDTPRWGLVRSLMRCVVKWCVDSVLPNDTSTIERKIDSL